MPKNVIELDLIHLAYIKKRLKSKMVLATNQDCVNYAIELSVNSIKYFDESTLDIVEPIPNKLK